MSRRGDRGCRGRAALFAAWAIGVAGAAIPEEPLYYYVENGEVVITNTPSRGDASPLPGFRGERPPPAAPRAPGPRPPGVGRLEPVFREAARRTGLSTELLLAVAKVESNFDPVAVSPKGAMGLMQLMPDTARSYGVSDPFDPRQNVLAGAIHLRSLLDQFGGSLRLALAAYNAGAATVKRGGDVPPYPETEAYVRRVHRELGEAEPEGVTSEAGREPEPEPVRMTVLPDGTILLVN